jgi:hypothetical protein
VVDGLLLNDGYLHVYDADDNDVEYFSTQYDVNDDDFNCRDNNVVVD